LSLGMMDPARSKKAAALAVVPVVMMVMEWG
jgi:hypothetical protein